jgi:DNA-binding NarL/FixJ family response regulator
MSAKGKRTAVRKWKRLRRAAPGGVVGVLLVEDHQVFREGLRDAINGQEGMRVVGESATWRGALSLVLSLAPDVIVLDLNLADGTGWTLLEQLHAQDELPPTLVLSVSNEALYARRLLRAGARGYLMKGEPIERILHCIREVHAGHLAASVALTSQLMAEALAQPAAVPVSDFAAAASLLSDRELQVFTLLGENLGNREVAERLHLSEKTVHTYKTRLMAKLGVGTTPELVALFQARRPPEVAAPGAVCPLGGSTSSTANDSPEPRTTP